MFDRFKKKDKQEKPSHIVVLKQTPPGACGGTDATRDMNAPTEIISQDMILFSAASQLGEGVTADPADRHAEPLTYVAAFAAPAEKGTFLFLETRVGHGFNGKTDQAWALVRENVFPSLVTLTRECDLAKSNGFHSTTHGLPQNFGGSVDICYAGGETIRFSNNQSPILSHETARAIEKRFTEAMRGERVPLPDVASLIAIRFSERRRNGGFTNATLTIHPDGTGTNVKSQRFEEPRIFESEKPVDAQTVSAIRENIRQTGLLAWAGLPDQHFAQEEEKSLTFVFADETEITVPSGRRLPAQIQGGFFHIELEMTTRH